MSEFVLLADGETRVKYDLASLERLGGGGEGDIYAISDNQCIKILTNPDADKVAVITHAAKTSRHVWEKLDLYATVPLFLVYDETGRQVRGYGMRRLSNSDEAEDRPIYGEDELSCTDWFCLGDIMTKDGAEKTGVGMKETAQIFLVLQWAVARIHSQGFVIGDFNSSNVFCRHIGGKVYRTASDGYWSETYQEDYEEWQVLLVDTDSWSINRPDIGLVYFPGIVDKMELYHPDYLRADIGDKDGNPLPHPQANESHDWWAFSFLLWKALTKHDPFTGGVIQGETTKSRLANIMAGVDRHLDFDTDPEIALSTLRLGPVMSNTLNRFLTLKFRRVFPALLLEQFIDEVCICPQCEEEMSRLAVFCSRCMTALS